MRSVLPNGMSSERRRAVPRRSLPLWGTARSAKGVLYERYPGVIPAETGIQCLFIAKTLGPRPPTQALGGRLRGDDDFVMVRAAASLGEVIQ